MKYLLFGLSLFILGCSKKTNNSIQQRSFSSSPTIGKAISETTNLYVLAVGTSEYVGNELDLLYAEEDARAFANTMAAIGTDSIFPQTNIEVLTTHKDDRNPSKENIEDAFSRLKEVQKNDVVIVYFAGHGIKENKKDDGYLYVTMHANSLEQVQDSAAQKTTAISGEELQQWLAAIPANKQVLILDTCAAGALDAAGGSKRDVGRETLPSIQRAITKLNKSSGTYILLGSAGDKESYEARKYGHSLLAYAMLEGIKHGSALGEGNVVDISKLFYYTQERVLTLARGIGEIQEPLVAIPDGQDFPLGMATTEAREQITLKNIKPNIVRPEFYEGFGYDSLELGLKLSEALRAEMDKDLLIFSDVTEAPQACRIYGAYEKNDDNTVTIDVRLDHKESEHHQTTLTGAAADLAWALDGMLNVIFTHCPKE